MNLKSFARWITYCMIGLYFPPLTIGSAVRNVGSEYLLSIPPNSHSGKNVTYTVQMSLPGKDMPAALDQSNWRFAAFHHDIILINFEMDYETIKSTQDIEND